MAIFYKWILKWMDHLVTRWWKHFLIYTKVLMREKDFYGKFKRKIVRQKEAGGIYLFESKESAHKYLMINTERLKGFGIEPVNGEIFEVNEGLTQIKWSQLEHRDIVEVSYRNRAM